MASEKSPDFACGQYLYSLKMSQLHYIVKETPFSVFITMRNKFIRDAIDHEEVNIDTNEKKDTSEKLKCLENEKLKLQNKINDDAKLIGMLRFENEELIKNGNLESEKIHLDDKIEDLYKEISIQKHTFLKENREELKAENYILRKSASEKQHRFLIYMIH